VGCLSEQQHKAVTIKQHQWMSSTCVLLLLLLLLQARLPRALLGGSSLGGALRYKKKMLMWRMPAAAGSQESPGRDEEPGVGYCMMTFVIRNGLAALKLGLQTYMGYVDNLARNWGLSPAHAAHVGEGLTAGCANRSLALSVP
jgi:hypothetical protein